MAETAEPAAEGQDEDRFADLRQGALWAEKLSAYRKVFQPWMDKTTSIEKIYANLDRQSKDASDPEMAVFWANMEVMKPSIYSRAPVPVVSGKFKDRKVIVNKAAEVLERALGTSFENEDINETIKEVRDDYALSARGVIWPRFERSEDVEAVRYEQLHRDDFAHEPARKWKEVGWAGRAAYLTRDEARERFEAASGQLYTQLQYSETKGKDGDKNVKGDPKAKIWEIWDRKNKVTVWYSEGLPEVLDIMDPPLTLKGFFPCPRPVYSTKQSGSLIPVPDYLFYRDQLEEINTLTRRITALTELLKLKGFYSAGSEELSTAIEAAFNTVDDRAILIPVANTGHLGQGMADALAWLPIDHVTNAIQAAVLLRRQIIEDVYQVTGISDIMRGSTDPNETLGAQQLKSQYGSVRVREKQEELVRIARDVARIAGEIMAEQFSNETLYLMSQYDSAPPKAKVDMQIAQIRQTLLQKAQDPQVQAQLQQNPQAAQAAQQEVQAAQMQVQQLEQTVTFDQIVEVIRNEKLRPFMLDIETDSTIQPDEDAAKQRSNEFLQALSNALGQLGPMVQANPQSAGFAGEVLKFAVAPYRAGRELDQAIDEFIEQTKKTSSQPKPDPAQVKAEADAKKAQADMVMEQQKHEADMAKMKAELEMKQQEHAMRMAEMQLELKLEQARAATQAQLAGIKVQAAQQTAEIKAMQPVKMPGQDYRTR